MSKVDVSKPIYKELIAVADRSGFQDELNDDEYVRIAQEIKELLKCEDKSISATEFSSKVGVCSEEIAKILRKYSYPEDKYDEVIEQIKKINVEKTSDLKHTLCVVQSLNAGDIRTGESLIYNLCCKYEFRKIIFQDVGCEDELLFSLKNIENSCEANEWVFLSIETHGELDGIRLNDDDVIPWKKFFNEIKAINKKSKMHLVLLSSMCYGSNFFEIIKCLDDGTWVAPFRWFFGPNQEESETKILKANNNIISSILKKAEIEVEKDLNENLQSLVDCSSYKGVNVCDLVMNCYTAMAILYLNPSFLRDRFEKGKGKKIETREEENEFQSKLKQDCSKETHREIFQKLWKTMLLDTDSFLRFDSNRFFETCWSTLAKKYGLQ